MNSKHTPGPWRFSRQRHHSRAIEQFWIDSNTRSCMALLEVYDINHNEKWRAEHPVIVEEWNKTLAEVEANARLIAQSPDLFDLAENLLIVLEYPCGSEAQIRCLEEVAQAARDIITKVEGQDDENS